MAAPTNVAAEATSITSTAIYWDYSGAATVFVYRSTDGITYTQVGFSLVGTKSFADSGLSVATKYWYKVSDDAGSTFSSVVTVYTQTCAGDNGDPSINSLALPRFSGDASDVSQLNNLAQQVEAIFGEKIIRQGECGLCVSNGQVIVDCGDTCTDFVVFATEDINSISINRCVQPDVNIKFVIPPNTTRKICGWPAGMGFGGDECRQNSFTTGAAGGSVNVGLNCSRDDLTADPISLNGSCNADWQRTSGTNSYNPGSSSAGATTRGAGGSTCTCTAVNGALTIKSCNPNNSLDCANTQKLQLKVCGGIGPYSWSRTGGVGMAAVGTSDTPAATATGSAVQVTPPTNLGSGVAGTAYQNDCYLCNTCSGGGGGGPNCTAVIRNNTALYKCDDSVISCAGPSGSCGSAPSIGQLDQDCPPPGAANSGGICPTSTTDLRGTCGSSGGVLVGVCDKRTAPMIAAGCTPCGLSAGDTVSVVDANGVTVTVILGG